MLENLKHKINHKIYRFKYINSTWLNLSKPVDVSLELSSYCTNACGYCYHSSPKELPFERGFMKFGLARKVITEARDLGAHSLKYNYRGESTMNPHFEDICKLGKDMANGSTFIDRVTNSNFNFRNDRNDIFRGLACQTKVKVSFDSFRKEIFERQRKGSNYEKTLANMDKFYNWPGRETEFVVQSVLTMLNKEEDLEYEIKSRWPSATISIRNCVEGRVNKDLTKTVIQTRDTSQRQSCIQAHARLMINHDGKVQVCCPDIGSKLLIGDANREHLSEIWQSPLAIRIRKELKNKQAFDFDPCKNCSSFESYAGYVAPKES